jgi:hypothetical protein
MIRLQIVDGSLQISNGAIIILVAPKNSCAIDVLALYDTIPTILIYNKYLGNSTNIFTQPLANCEDSIGTPFTVDSFITFAEEFLGFETSGGGGGSGGTAINYYLNGGTVSNVATYYQMSNAVDTGAGVNFTLNGNGLITQWLTDFGNPNVLEIPSGAWNFEIYMSASNNSGNPEFYVELLKYDGSTFTTISDNLANPEGITNGTTIDLYLTSIPVPQTTLLATDRLALRIYIVNNTAGRVITMHTQDSTICEVITTFIGGITSLNGLTETSQVFDTTTSGTDFSIVSSGMTHYFNMPSASATARGVVTNGSQTIAGAKTFSTAPNLSSLTSSEILALDSSKNIQSLSVATYPSLTELSYVKGVTSALQTQLDNKIAKNVGATYTTNAITTVTLAEYNAISPKDANTLYFII